MSGFSGMEWWTGMVEWNGIVISWVLLIGFHLHLIFRLSTEMLGGLSLDNFP